MHVFRTSQFIFHTSLYMPLTFSLLRLILRDDVSIYAFPYSALFNFPFFPLCQALDRCLDRRGPGVLVPELGPHELLLAVGRVHEWPGGTLMLTMLFSSQPQSDLIILLQHLHQFIMLIECYYTIFIDSLKKIQHLVHLGRFFNRACLLKKLEV